MNRMVQLKKATTATIATATRSAAGKPEIKALIVRIKWPTEAADAFVEEHEIDDIATLSYLNKDMAIALYHTLCKPGRSDNGIKLSVIAEETLKLLLYFTKHCDQISHSARLNDIKISHLRALMTQRDLKIASKDDPKPDMPKVNLECMLKTMKNVKE